MTAYKIPSNFLGGVFHGEHIVSHSDMAATQQQAHSLPTGNSAQQRGLLTEEQDGALRMTALAEVQGVPMGQYALTWMPSFLQKLMSSSLRQKGCTSTWLMAGRMRAYSSTDCTCLVLKLLTPMHFTSPCRHCLC